MFGYLCIQASFPLHFSGKKTVTLLLLFLLSSFYMYLLLFLLLSSCYCLSYPSLIPRLISSFRTRKSLSTRLILPLLLSSFPPTLYSYLSLPPDHCD